MGALCFQKKNMRIIKRALFQRYVFLSLQSYQMIYNTMGLAEQSAKCEHTGRLHGRTTAIVTHAAACTFANF